MTKCKTASKDNSLNDHVRKYEYPWRQCGKSYDTILQHKFDDSIH